MGEAPIALGAYKRGSMPEYPTVNVLSEKGPNGKDHIRSRPGLEEFETVATQPARCLFQKQGLCDDSAIIVSDDDGYALDSAGARETMTGTVGGAGRLDVDGGLDADGDSIVRMANGAALYKLVWSTKVITQEDFPSAGGAGATSVQFYKGYWLAVEAGTDFLYFQLPAATTWGQLEFAAAEYAPDKLVAVRVFGDLFALLGSATTEIWYATGNSSSPLEPYGGLNFDFGCRSRDAAVNCAGALIWVDHNCQVRLCEGGDARTISDHGLTEQIRQVAAEDLRASFFVKDGHACYVLTIGADATWVYDLTTSRWSRFDSLGYDFWRAHLFCNIGGSLDTVLAADALSNQVWRLDPDRRTDGDDVFTVRFPAVIEVPEGTFPLANVELDCEVGDAPRSGQGSAPVIVLRVSRDRKTYGPPRERSLGATGEYLVQPRWNALGDLRAPGGHPRLSGVRPGGKAF